MQEHFKIIVLNVVCMQCFCICIQANSTAVGYLAHLSNLVLYFIFQVIFYVWKINLSSIDKYVLIQVSIFLQLDLVWISLIVLCSTFVCCTVIGYLVNISSMSIDQLPSVSKTYQDVKIFRYLDVKIFIYPNIWRIYQAKQQASDYPVSQLKPIKFGLCLETTLPIVSQSCSNIAGISIHLID